MAWMSSCASGGEPSASITTTPAGVTTKAALEMKLRLAGVPSADAPCTIHTPGATSFGCSGVRRRRGGDQGQPCGSTGQRKPRP